MFLNIEHNQYYIYGGGGCKDTYKCTSGIKFREARNFCSMDPECALFYDDEGKQNGKYCFCKQGAQRLNKDYNHNLYVKGMYFEQKVIKPCIILFFNYIFIESNLIWLNMMHFKIKFKFFHCSPWMGKTNWSKQRNLLRCRWL